MNRIIESAINLGEAIARHKATRPIEDWGDDTPDNYPGMGGGIETLVATLKLFGDDWVDRRNIERWTRGTFKAEVDKVSKSLLWLIEEQKKQKLREIKAARLQELNDLLPNTCSNACQFKLHLKWPHDVYCTRGKILKRINQIKSGIDKTPVKH